MYVMVRVFPLESLSCRLRTIVELGILVWQDFQFACGVYPGNDEFVESVRAEAVDNVKRLRHHPSIAIFCGNNEGTRSSYTTFSSH